MNKEPESPTDHLNANQFDEDGLPGIDPEFPPDRAWAVDDPALVSGDADTRDDLRTRVSREHASAVDGEMSSDDADSPLLMDPDSGDPAVEGDRVDHEGTSVGRTGRRDPDAGLSAEEAAIHVIEEPPA